MGMYTQIDFEVTLKPEFLDLVQMRMLKDSWTDVAKEFSQYPWLVKFAGYPRADAIPFGLSAYFDSFEQDGFELEGML